MSEKLEEFLLSRLSQGRSWLTFPECIGFVLLELECLIEEQRIDPDVYNKVKIDLTCKLRRVLNPDIPDPQEVKTAIRSRIAQMRTVVVKLPVETDSRNVFDRLLDSL